MYTVQLNHEHVCSSALNISMLTIQLSHVCSSAKPYMYKYAVQLNHVCSSTKPCTCMQFSLTMYALLLKHACILAKPCMQFSLTVHIVQLRTVCSSLSQYAANLKNEPPRDKTNKMNVRPAKTQLSLGVRPI